MSEYNMIKNTKDKRVRIQMVAKFRQHRVQSKAHVRAKYQAKASKDCGCAPTL
jgi:hypothetical protein